MRKILMVLTVCLSMICSAVFVGADTEFTVSAKVDFDASTVTVSIETPAHYGQNILITMYEKGADITSPTQYLRICEVFADRNGSAELTVNLSDIATGDYTISASGGGYLAESCRDKTDFYFETTDDLNNVTLPSISAASGSELNELLVKLETYFSVDLGDGYKDNQAAFLNFFEAVRKEDFGNVLDTIGKVQETADRANLIMTTLSASKQSDIETLYEENYSALSFDKTNTDYSDNKADVYRIYLGLIKANRSSVKNLGDLRLALKQAMGMAVINSKNAENVTEKIKAYGDVYNIPVEKYTEYCSRYGEINMNKNFIGRNFTKPAEVLAAYKDAVAAVTETGKNSGGISSAGGSSRSSSSVIKGDGNNTSKDFSEKIPTFSDVPVDHWAYEPIKALSDIGVVSGFEDGNFKPDTSVTREQFVKMLVTAFKLTDNAEDDTQSFSDVPEGHWAETFIKAAVCQNIVNGISDTEFGLGSALTRQDAVVLISRTAGYQEQTTDTKKTPEFTDWSEISDYAKESVSNLCSAGILSGMGDGSFAPALSITRAQAAKILYGVLSLR